MRRRKARRAYALAMVMLAMVASGAMLAVMLDRQGAQSLAVRRHLDQYQEHHGVRGLEEVIEAWLKTLQGEDVSQVVTAEGGRVLELVLADRSTATVALAPGQGELLARPTMADATQRQTAMRLVERVRALVRPEELPALTRDAGPLVVDIRHTAEPILIAIVEEVLGEPNDALVRELVRLGQSTSTRRADITRAAADAGLTPEQRSRLNELVTTEAELWRIRVEVRPPRLPGQIERVVSAYEGLVRLSPRANRASGGRIFLSFAPAAVE